MNNRTFTLICLLCSIWTTQFWAQTLTKKTLDHEQLTSWRSIGQTKISNNGQWIAYTVSAEEGDGFLMLQDQNGRVINNFERATKPVFTADNEYLVFSIVPHEDSIKNQKRRKVKKEDFPKDTLGIYNITAGSIERIPNVSSFAIGEKWSEWFVYHLELTKPAQDSIQKDTTEAANENESKQSKSDDKKPKKESKDNGSTLVIKSLRDTSSIQLPFVTNYTIAKEKPALLMHSTGDEKECKPGIYYYNGEEVRMIIESENKCRQIALQEKGEKVAVIMQSDTSDNNDALYTLSYWDIGLDTVLVLADSASSFMPETWRLSKHTVPDFSSDGTKLFFGIQPQPLAKDTSLLDEEIANVEVWHWLDPMLHTQQTVRKDEESKRSYDVCYDINSSTFTQVNNLDIPEITYGDERNGDVVMIYDERPYYKNVSWAGFPSGRDVYVLDLKSGDTSLVGRNIRAYTSLSPQSRYLYWYAKTDSLWMVHDIESKNTHPIKLDNGPVFYDEEFDMPDHPNSYGMMGWSEGDEYILLYDRYDIWKIDPEGTEVPEKLTQGREKKMIYRYINLDPEEKNINLGAESLLLYTFDETSKQSGYASLNPVTLKVEQLIIENKSYTRAPQKALNADVLLFTKEDFNTFPDLYVTKDRFKSSVRISDVNPQQKEYNWGTAELYTWTSLDGKTLNGLLYKPEGFDPKMKYPMIVNFYEKSSDGLFRHRPPSPGRSTINYPFYTSRGYVLFIPDIPYRDGYPGESAYNAVIPGITSLINQGFIDKDRIGVQGHSWGGYQIAYLLTRTNIFRCAESGAPVVNMTSAYGGIRWETGLSRMFQYEHTQSRIGGTLWEYPMRYIENSPLFAMDKVETPVLIMHNDKDGHVPWYQGIEYFVALRRLGKPAWMLNYNDEPHWPLRLENRKDFNIRLQQFFDHYLKDEPMPLWMKRGVPATEKGILQGYELSED